MNLQNQIKRMQAELIPQIPEDALRAIMAGTERLMQSGLAEKGFQKGDKAPPFSLPNARGEVVSSTELLTSGPLVVSFYRGGWCPYCNLELRALQQALPEIKELGAQLVAISPELPDKTISTVEKHSLGFEVLSDVWNKVARKFGLVYSLDEELRPVYQHFGFNIPAHNGDDSYELPIPATYVIDTEGTIVLSFVDADYTRRLEPTEIIGSLKRRKAA